MKNLTERQAIDLIRATATKGVPNCINLDVIDRIIAAISLAPTAINGYRKSAMVGVETADEGFMAYYQHGGWCHPDGYPIADGEIIKWEELPTKKDE